jgi:hypothetical protein
MTFAFVRPTISFFAAFGLIGLSNAFGACNPRGLPLTPAMINDFLQKPEIILSDDARGRRALHDLSVSISQYAAAGPAAIQAIKSVLPNATIQQRLAIGEGLYRAIGYCRAIDPVTAARIESAVKSISDEDVTLAYRLGVSSSNKSPQPKLLNGFASTRRPIRLPGLIAEPSPDNPGSLKLSEPFGSPDTWR